MPSQPYALSCEGGLDKSSSSFELLRRPGAATLLENFEVDIAGGYRRVNGYTALGGDSAANPSAENDILGLHVYADGVIACTSTNIYFSQDGTSWLQINKDSVAGGGDNYSTFTGRSALTRTSQGKAHFATYEGNTTYGEVIITDEGSGVKPFYFKMTGTDSALSARTYFAKEITIDGTEYPKYCTMHDKHLVVAGASTTPNTIYYSDVNDIDDFSGGTSGNIVLDDQVVGLRSFREDLIIFCRNSIWKLSNINATISVAPITKNIGCLDGKSIQEIGGDLVFLAPDGIRTLAGTVRIGDVELGTVSRAIQPVIKDIADNIGTYNISTIVIRDKSQYRLYYGTSSTGSSSRGIIGTLKTNEQGATQFQWSETVGIDASAAAASGFNYSGVEKHYHGDYTGRIFNHDVGDNFLDSGSAASNIIAKYQTPDLDYGDLGTLKTLKYVKLSITPEGTVDTTLRIRYNFDDLNSPKPSDYSLSIPKPSLFGTAVFGATAAHKFGAASDPITRQVVEGSGHSNYFRVFSDNQNSPYTVNGIYIDYAPSGRQ